MQGYNGSINTVQAVEVMKSKLTLWDASAVLLAVPVALPVLAILLSFFGESGDTFGHLATTVLPDYLLNTVLLMLLVGVIALMVGVPTAWLTARYRFRVVACFLYYWCCRSRHRPMCSAMFMRICLITPASANESSSVVGLVVLATHSVIAWRSAGHCLRGISLHFSTGEG